MRTGLCDSSKLDSFVQDKDRVDTVSQILEWAKNRLNFTSSFQVTCLNGFSQFLTEIGTNTNAAGGKAVHTKANKMIDYRLFPNTTDDDFGIDLFHQLSQVGIVRRIFANNRVFDPRNESVVDKLLCAFDINEISIFDVDHDWLADSFRKFS